MRPDISTIVPVGHSAGASTAAELAVPHDTVGGVALLAVTAQTEENTLTWQAAQIAPTLPALARGVLRLMRTDVMRQQRKALDRIMAAEGDAARVQGAKVNVRWVRGFIAYDPIPTLGRIEVAVLAMTGLKDVQVDLDDIGVIAALLPSAQTHVVVDVDHILRHEPRPRSDVRSYKKQVAQPIDPRVETLLLDWLADIPQGSNRSARGRRGGSGTADEPADAGHAPTAGWWNLRAGTSGGLPSGSATTPSSSPAAPRTARVRTPCSRISHLEQSGRLPSGLTPIATGASTTPMGGCATHCFARTGSCLTCSTRPDIAHSPWRSPLPETPSVLPRRSCAADSGDTP